MMMFVVVAIFAFLITTTGFTAEGFTCNPSSSSSWGGVLQNNKYKNKNNYNYNHWKQEKSSRPIPWKATTYSKNSRLYSGFGIATNYTWQEEAYEIDVTVKVPANVQAKDVQFDVTSRRFHLQYEDPNSPGEMITLMDKNRKLRGRLQVDGTYWVISDDIIQTKKKQEKKENIEDDDDSLSASSSSSSSYREITITLEKLLKTPQDDFQIIEYDWRGIYVDDQDEVTQRHYDEPETLNVREYAQSMGVDIDNINRSMVDTTMFSNNMNLTHQSLDALYKSGYLETPNKNNTTTTASNDNDDDDNNDIDDDDDYDDLLPPLQQVTQQSDGREYIFDDDGQAIPYSPYGKAIHPDEMVQRANERKTTTAKKVNNNPIPFLDTDSPWHKAATTTTTTTTTNEEATSTTSSSSTFDDPISTSTSSMDDDSDGSTTATTPSSTTSDEKSSSSSSSYYASDPISDGSKGNTIVDPVTGKRVYQRQRDMSQAAFQVDMAKKQQAATTATTTSSQKDPSKKDPIDLLNIEKLQEILHSQGLDTSGNKQELKDRLRQRVNTLLQGQQQD